MLDLKKKDLNILKKKLNQQEQWVKHVSQRNVEVVHCLKLTEEVR